MSVEQSTANSDVMRNTALFLVSFACLVTVNSRCFALRLIIAFTGFCSKLILYEIILYECYGHGKNFLRLF